MMKSLKGRFTHKDKAKPDEHSSNVTPADSSSSNPAPTFSEDMLVALGRYDTVFLLDDSTSMEGGSWEELKTAFGGLVEKTIKYDKDGLDIHFLNYKHSITAVNSVEAVEDVFKKVYASGSTPTGPRMRDILTPYVDSLDAYKASPEGKTRPKPMMLLIITDGEANDNEAVKEVILDIAKRLDAGKQPSFQLGIQFIQIGKDQYATQFLKSLDDDLKHKDGVRDIVDTVPYAGSKLTGDFILQALLGSINRKVDEQNTSSLN